jgi:RNA polymerase sigma-70 factor, ECF subfamily
VTFDSFFSDQGKPLMAAAYALTGDLGESQDLVQDVMLRTWRSWSRVSKMDKPEAWARRVLINLAIGRFRRLRSSRSSGGAELHVPPPDVGHIDVSRALRRLPHKQMNAILLHDVLGLSVVEVAAEMGSPEGSVRAWLSVGRRALAGTLGLNSPTAGEQASRAEEDP